MKYSVRSVLAVVAVLLLATIACSPDAGDGTTEAYDPSIPQPLDWPTVVGADYEHRSACEQTIKDHLRLDRPGFAGLLEPPDGVSFAGLPVPPDSKAGADNLACVWDVFAWNSFAALNWPANIEPGKRGLSSAKTSFLDNRDAGAEVVWESFKEKRELFQRDPSPHWNDLQDGREVKSFHKPSNLWDQFGGYCSKSARDRAGTASSGPFAANKFHNQLDETAEVQSQALESLSLLCRGHGSDCLTDGEISNQSVVGPRVWLGEPIGGRPLYYEVKVNYDFFDYLMNPPKGMALPTPKSTLVDDEVAATNAMLNNIRLPWRTTAPKTETANQNAVFGYGPVGCNPTVGRPEEGVDGASVPCRSGAVHMKAAWVRLTDDEIAQDPPRYHTTTALFYETPEEGKTCIAVDSFGLVGLHAIQRVKTENAKGEPDNPGGAFIFATWEHRSVLDKSYPYGEGYSYVNLLTNPAFGDFEAGEAFPAVTDALDVTRMIPTGGNPEAETTCGLSAEQTCQVNAAALEMLEEKKSVWANYRLVGTQFMPNDCSFMAGSPAAYQLASCRYNTLAKLGQPHFLANTLIETNKGLQHFMGLPPQQPRLQPFRWCEPSADDSLLCDNQGRRKIGPNQKQTGAGSVFVRGAANVTYEGQATNMGGCQGCHGVAQQNGYSFSFVLLDGVGGADPDTERVADVPATAIAQSVLVRLRSATDATQYLAIGPVHKKNRHYRDLVLSDKAGAALWRLRPYTSSPNIGNFAGEIVLYNPETKGVLLLGIGGGGIGGAIGTKNSALVGPVAGGGSVSRAPPSQTVYLVKYKGKDAPAGDPYQFVSAQTTADSSGAVHYLLNASSTGKVSAEMPAAAGSSGVLDQVFDIEVVPLGL